MVRLGLKPLCLFVFLAMLRLVLPVELPFTQIVSSRKILVWVQRGFRIHLAQLGGHSIQTGDVFLFVWLWGAALLLGQFLWQWARHGRYMAQCPSIPREMMEKVENLAPGVPGPGAPGGGKRDALCHRLFPSGDLSAGYRHEKGGEVHHVPRPFVLKREILHLRMAHDILNLSCLHIFTVSLGV